MISSISLVVCLAFAVAAVTDLLRTLLWNTRLRNHKPLACDVCMSWWLSLALGLVMRAAWPAPYGNTWRAWVWLLATSAAAAGVSILILAAQRHYRNDLAGPPPQL